MEKLTNQQEKMLDIIKKYVVKHGYAPTVRELCQEMNLSSTATVQVHLNNLEKKGYIKKEESKNRTIEILVDNEYEIKNELITEVPLLGKITAGNPIEAIERPDEYFSLPSYLINEVTLKTFYKEKDHFRLQPENDTMAPFIMDNVTILGKAIGLYRKI